MVVVGMTIIILTLSTTMQQENSPTADVPAAAPTDGALSNPDQPQSDHPLSELNERLGVLKEKLSDYVHTHLYCSLGAGGKQMLRDNHVDVEYFDLFRHVTICGQRKKNRTGIDTIQIFGAQSRYNLEDGFPLLTTKKIHWKSVVHELLWFLKGDTNIAYLKENGVRIWDEWADENGDLGPVYGHQWRSFGSGGTRIETAEDEFGEVRTVEKDIEGVDQIKQVMKSLKENPDSRRHIVSAWNPMDVEDMALPPCHCLFQFNMRKDELTGRLKLDCELYQRSADLFLGVPFNIASYSLLLVMMAHCLDVEAGEFVHTFGDLHVYENHIEKGKEQGKREPRCLPTVRIKSNAPKDLFALTFDDIILQGYDPHPAIPAKVAV